MALKELPTLKCQRVLIVSSDVPQAYSSSQLFHYIHCMCDCIYIGSQYGTGEPI